MKECSKFASVIFQKEGSFEISENAVTPTHTDIGNSDIRIMTPPLLVIPHFTIRIVFLDSIFIT